MDAEMHGDGPPAKMVDVFGTDVHPAAGSEADLIAVGGVAISIAAVWAVLFGTAWLCRRNAGLNKVASAAIVTGCYLALATTALSWFGWNATGLLSISGMILPWLVGIGIVLIPRHTR
jgi:hypothetical protein